MPKTYQLQTDSCSPEEAKSINDALLRAFILCRIPLHVIESDAFIEVLRQLRPAYAYYIPPRKELVGSRLTDYQAMTRHQMEDLMKNWITSSKAVLSLEGSDDPEYRHFVNIMAIFGHRSVFLASLSTSSCSKIGETVSAASPTHDNDARALATQAQAIIDRQGGPRFFSAIAADNTRLCSDICALLCQCNPYMIPLNNQAHVANLFLSELTKVGLLADSLRHSENVSKFVRQHPHFHARFLSECHSFNQNLPENVQPAVEFPLETSNLYFNHRLQMLEAFARNQTVTRSLVQADNGRLISSLCNDVGNTSTRQQLDEFCSVVLDSSIARNAVTAFRILCPVRVYLRIFDEDKARLSHVVPETLKLHSHLNNVCSELVNIQGIDFSKQLMNKIMDRYILRQFKPAQQGHGAAPLVQPEHFQSSLLLEPLQFLAATLDPNVCPQQECGRFFDASLVALKQFFIDDQKTWSDNELASERSNRQKILTAELAIYVAGEGSFCNGGALRRQHKLIMLEHNLDDDMQLEQICSKGWWEAFGSSTPHLKTIALTLLSLPPTPRQARDKSATTMKMIQSAMRSKLSHRATDELLYTVINSRVLQNVPEAIDVDFISSMV